MSNNNKAVFHIGTGKLETTRRVLTAPDSLSGGEFAKVHRRFLMLLVGQAIGEVEFFRNDAAPYSIIYNTTDEQQQKIDAMMDEYYPRFLHFLFGAIDIFAREVGFKSVPDQSPLKQG